MKYTPLRNTRLTVLTGLAFLFAFGMACLNGYMDHTEWSMAFSSFSGILLHMLLLQYQDHRRRSKLRNIGWDPASIRKQLANKRDDNRKSRS